MRGELTLIEGVFEHRAEHPLTEGVAIEGDYPVPPAVGERFLLTREDDHRALWTGHVKSLRKHNGCTYFRTNRSTYRLLPK